MDKSKKLSSIDFSQQSIQKAVYNEILQNPLTLYSIMFALIGTFSNVIIFHSAFIYYLSFLALVIGSANLFINLFLRKDSFATKYINAINKQIEDRQKKILINLKNDLEKYQSIKGLENYSNQAVKQYGYVQKKFESFKKLLSEKFNSKELTYARLYGTAEQLYLCTLDNLTNIENTLESVSNIDDVYIEERFKILNSLQTLEDADKREIETLKKRKELRIAQLEKINELLTINEEAMTQIDLSLASISSAKTQMGRATLDMETAREELQDLIQRTKKYAV